MTQIAYRVRRYLLPEVAGCVTTFLAVWISLKLELPLPVVAYIGTWSENLGFYTTRLLLDIRRRSPDETILKILRNVLLEFGPAELLDSFFLRPLLMGLGMAICEMHPAGAFLGKVLADLIFYLVASVSDESRKRVLG